MNKLIEPTGLVHTRPASAYMDSILGQRFDVLDHGHVRVIDYMGDDACVVQAARVSYQMGTEHVSSETGLIRRLMRDAHSSPFEQASIKVHMKMPMAIGEQILRHRTGKPNKVSGRYSILPGEFYIPAPEFIAIQSVDNKQGRSAVLDPELAAEVVEVMNRHAATSYGLYEDLARETDKGGEYGLARELARFNLPANIYTEMYWKIDLRNLLHFLNLRLDGHAQYEVRVYAEVLWQIVQDWMPITANAFRDYVLEAHTFSRQEMEVLRGLVASYSDASTLDTVLVMSGVKNVTERKAFLKALGV